MSKCATCGKTTDRYGDTIFCAGPCKGAFHLTCAQVTEKEFCDMRASKFINLWKCIICNNSACNTVQNPDLPYPTVLETKLDIILDRLNQMDKTLANVVEENRKYREKIDHLENKCATLERKIMSNTDCIFNEVQDRLSRANNIIMFNAPESVSQDYNVRNDEDLCLVKAFISKVSDVTTDEIEAFRLGKPNDANKKPRPIKVKLNSSLDAVKVLKNKYKTRNLDSPIRIAADSTPMQRDILKNVKLELERRISNGEKDITIRYVKGVPTIVQTSKN